MIVLDTHVLVWWASGDSRLSSKAKRAIHKELASEQGMILIAAISAWEIALLINKGRLTLSMNLHEWLQTIAEIPGVQFAALEKDILVQSVQLPEPFHADPADRMIVALARHHSATLISADEKIRGYRHVRTLW